MPVANALVERGHEVRWLAGREFEQLVESTGAGFEPFVHSHDPAHGGGLAERFPQREALSGVAGITFDIKHVFLDEIPAQVRDYRRVLATYDADVVVADTGVMGTRVQHELGGPRWASIGVTPLALPSRDVAPFGPGLPPPRTNAARLRAGLLSFGMRVAMRGVERHHAVVRARLGLPRSPLGVFEAVASPYLFLQTGTEAVDYPRSDLPPQVHYVGPLVSSGLPSSSATDWSGLAGGRPIVVLTQGTVATGRDSLVGPGLRALAGEPVHVVAVGGERPEVLPANAVHVPYLPYDEVLPHASAMVTNGGYGGVQIALAHGVPLAIAGTTEDKPEVAARIAWAGAGLDLRKADPTEAALRDAVRRLLEEPGLREAARRIAQDFAAHDAGRTSAELLEALARAPHEVGPAAAAGRVPG
ncbi:nucleotide disphospho-sugar-binding domain-containing protein [Nocardioides sp. SYSU D00038]|uniref:nucleotide disphospho-sugar-binding domain-containing protein n=1 Tax=Nocardioides sp. SYSU D00038 TaxID=2812554 RepID=UPI00196746EA|nr:nucleotide disphospho-sugar-binding domain-containing protein [Nocardioides sp. SYSU D00038]